MIRWKVLIAIVLLGILKRVVVTFIVVFVFLDSTKIVDVMSL